MKNETKPEKQLIYKKIYIPGSHSNPNVVCLGKLGER